MGKRLSIYFSFLTVPVDALMLLLAAVSAYLLRFSSVVVSIRPPVFSLTLGQFFEIALWLLPLWLLIFAISGLYGADPNEKLGTSIFRSLIANAAAIGIVAMYLLFAQQQFDSRFLVAAGWGFATVYIMLGRILLRGLQAVLYRRRIGLTTIAIVGPKKERQAFIDELQTRPSLGYDVCAQGDDFDDAMQKKVLTTSCHELLLISPQDHKDVAQKMIAFANEHHLVMKYTADLFSTYAANSSIAPLAGLPVVELKKSKIEGWGFVIKRVFDIVVSIIFIILTAPIMVVTAIAIVLDTKGPVFFSYKRVGEKGTPFTYTKFRSMVPDAHKLRYDPTFRKKVKDTRGFTADNPMIKYENDPRITRVGKIIRRYSIDELPEFFLVLKGDMSLVGPRPHEPEEVEKYKPAYKRVLWLKPGITGLAQVSGRSDLSFDQEVQLDMLYMEKWSVFLDIILIIKTPFILIKRRKAL